MLIVRYRKQFSMEKTKCWLWTKNNRTDLFPYIFDQKQNISFHEMTISNIWCCLKKSRNRWIETKTEKINDIIILKTRIFFSKDKFRVCFTGSLPPMISLSKISTRSLLVFPIDSSFQRSTTPSTTDAHRSHFGLKSSFNFKYFLLSKWIFYRGVSVAR